MPIAYDTGQGKTVERGYNFPASDWTESLPFTSLNDPPNGIDFGDNQFLLIGYYITEASGDNVAISPGPGWVQRTASGGTNTGASSSSRSGVLLYYRQANGTAADRPVITVTKTGSNGSSLVYIAAHIWGRRGGSLSFIGNGANGAGFTPSNPTPPQNVSVANDSYIVSIGRFHTSASVDPPPKMTTSNNFQLRYGQTTPGGTTSGPRAAPPRSMSDQFVQIGGTIALPRWNSYSQSSTTNSHCWAIFTQLTPNTLPCEIFYANITNISYAKSMRVELVSDTLVGGAAAHTLFWINNTTSNITPYARPLSAGPWILGAMGPGERYDLAIAKTAGGVISGSVTLRAYDLDSSVGVQLVIECNKVTVTPLRKIQNEWVVERKWPPPIQMGAGLRKVGGRP